ncbi:MULTISPECIES: hypothetical protein [Limosilactobacillus]|uniref:Uncharacterized protein n=1 Tax=Limosilactobacillus reuteri TaxID=1598 RepID=A0A256STZ3_LIMRT|nr:MULTISPECIES: hypothetical protein [Limosilactobacillus]MDD7006525.1 hypothetical protein [Lactobacillus johnsonii]MCD7136007.1 hypothetical protein [Limosilactobacillus balticus]MDE7040171.1 hypothetical protein [Limosilactobacillus sp.]MDY6195396.1 hypothetical protein [Lactobacillus johnsonii]MQB75040.1 hypothetical protein [Limosilactobacillus reuteri]
MKVLSKPEQAATKIREQKKKIRNLRVSDPLDNKAIDLFKWLTLYGEELNIAMGWKGQNQ